MQTWIAIPLFLLGAWLIYSGLSHRAQVLAARRRALASGDIDPSEPASRSLAGFGRILRPLVIAGVGYFALKATLAYAFFGGDRVFSLLDLGGLLFLLASYAAWLVLMTTYRETTRRHAEIEAEFDIEAKPEIGVAPGIEIKEDALVS